MAKAKPDRFDREAESLCALWERNEIVFATDITMRVNIAAALRAESRREHLRTLRIAHEIACHSSRAAVVRRDIWALLDAAKKVSR